MIKRLLLTGLLSLAPLPAAAAIYAGVDLGVDSTGLDQSANSLFPQSTIGPSVHIGDHFGGFGVEMSYGSSSRAEQQTDLRYNRLTGDGLAYVPIGGFLDLVLTAGLSQTNYGASTYQLKGFTNSQGVLRQVRQSTTLLHGDQLDWRGGGGFSFPFLNGYEFHVIGRYEPLTMKGLSNYAISLDTGFNIDLN